MSDQDEIEAAWTAYEQERDGDSIYFRSRFDRWSVLKEAERFRRQQEETQRAAAELHRLLADAPWKNPDP